MQRIAASPLLVKSPRLRNLLEYITRKAIEGRVSELTEAQIGVHVFGRPEGYSCGEDNIVRSHARLLRQKLETYFEQTGETEDLILTIPKGGYVPVFEPRKLRNREPPAALAETPAGSSTPLGWKWRWILAAVVVVLAGVGVWNFAGARNAPNGRESHLLWSRIFQTNRNTVLVPADSGLVMYENLARRGVPLAEYLSRKYLADPLPGDDVADSRIRGLGSRRYTSLADLEMMVQMARLPEAAASHFRIRYARDLSMGDFKESNVVLSGAAEANPWLELFDSRLNFKIEDDQVRGVFQVTNKNPAAGQPAAYAYDPLDSQERAYAVVAFFTGETNALIIEGTTVAGTEAAADFVLDDKAVSPILKKATLADGTLGDFQVLMETRNLDGSAPQARVVAARYQNGGR